MLLIFLTHIEEAFKLNKLSNLRGVLCSFADYDSLMTRIKDIPFHKEYILNVKLTTLYYYWLRKFRKQAYAQMHLSSTEVSVGSDISFAEVSIPDQKPTGIPKATEETTVEAIRPVAVIKNADITIALTNEVSDSLLSRILREVAHA